MNIDKDLERIEAEAVKEKIKSQNKEAVEAGGFVVVPAFEGLCVKVHPAIDVVNGEAFVGVTLPCKVYDGKKEREQEFHFFITSNRRKILAHSDVLQKLRLKLAYRCVHFENRWSLKSIQGWLETGQAPEPEKVYEMVKKAWKTYIEFSDEVIYDFLTLWTIGTYFFHLFNSYPYIYIGGLKQTGKTKVLTVASLMCFNAISSNNLSTPSIFRLIQSGRCTLLMDETEKLVNKERASELRNLLLSGYKKGMKVYRTEKTRGEKLVPEAFEVYSPKMIANIYGLEDVLEDRCILIIMRRAKNAEIGNREPKADDQIWQDIRDCLYTFCLSYWQKISECYERSEGSEPTEYNISERDYELWKPILALAKFFSFTSVASQHAHPTQPTLFDKILRFAKEKVEEKKVENITETGEYVLVQTLLKIVNESSFYKVKAIKGAMAENYDEEQKWLTTEWIGRALKRLGFTEKRRVGTGVEYNLSKEAVLDLAERLQVKLEKQEDEQPILVSVKSWCLANRNEMGEISLTELAEFITKELKQDPKHVVTTAFNQGILMPSNKPGLMVVV